MVLKINNDKIKCPFCGNALESKYSKCYNIYCQGQKFNIDNLVLYRFNPKLDLGRIIKVIDIPSSKTLDDEDTFFITKFKVLFKNNLIKIIHPIDLIHYIFNVNDIVITKKGVGVVNSQNFLLKDGKISYEIIFPNGKLEQIYESETISSYEIPIKRYILTNKIDPPKNFLIKYWANLFHSYYTSYQVKCITNSRLTLMPHQINVAHRLTEEFFPRVILADEVGLGKTIEAGIYIKEMMARNLAERILIIVPATLLKQWHFEMLNKFNINFTIYDGKKIKELKKGSYKIPELFQNPFRYDNLIICSLQFARNKKYATLLSQISWDIVIFDEAHHLRRYLMNSTTGNYKETLNFTLARKLSENSECLLLLTATPLQLHSFELYSLIELIHPEIFDNFSDFEHYRKNIPFINLLISNINNIGKLNTFELENTIRLLKELKHIDTDEDPQIFLEQIKNPLFKIKLLKNIEKDHTLSQFLIRNRKKNVFSKEFLNIRVVNAIMVNPTQQELDIYNEIRNYLAKVYNMSLSQENIGLGFVITTLQKLLTSSKFAFIKSISRRLEQINRLKNLSLELKYLKEEDPEYLESFIEEEYLDEENLVDINDNTSIKDNQAMDLPNQEKMLKEFYEKLINIQYDSKSDKLIELIDQIYNRNNREKIIIFTQFVDTLLFLRDLFKNHSNNYYVEIFYGKMDKNEKDDAVERFRTNKNFSILISTEIGGEGRNFQFCRILINYDLPWNPMRLEQRIGRLDRIGQQSREIYIYNLFLEGTIETDIIFALNKRINLFEESIGTLEPIIGTIENDIKDIIFLEANKPRQRTKLNEFIHNVEDDIKKTKEIELQLEDLMIDKKSFQMDGLLTSISACEEVKLSHNELFLFMKYFFDLNNHEYGYFETINGSSEVQKSRIMIKLNENLMKILNHHLSKEKIGTFDLELAREREEIEFFALGHPLVDNILDFCTSSPFKGKYTIINLKNEILSKTLKSTLLSHTQYYLFIFDVKFQGFIVENQISAIIIDESGYEISVLSDFILNIKNFDLLFQCNQDQSPKIKVEKDKLEILVQNAKNLVKRRISNWKKEIKILNDKIFDIELKKRNKIYSHKRKVLTYKSETLKFNLERKINQKPSEKQLNNIFNIEDETKRKEKLDRINDLDEEIIFIKKDIDEIKKKMDDLAFEHEDVKNEMVKKNLAKFYTNLLGIAIIRIMD